MAKIDFSRLPQYEVGKYPKNQLDKVQTLFSQAFGGRTLSTEWLQWHMEKNPCLKERATTLWQGDTLVAYNALTPFRAILCGEEIIAAVSGTKMADENFPGASIQLSLELEEQNQDIQMLYGFPNRNMLRICTKYLKRHIVGNIAFWMTEARKTDISAKIHEFHTFTGEYEALSRELSRYHEFIKIRNEKFLNWRFFQKPGYYYRGFEYEKRGYFVANTYVENGTKQLQVVDILADSEEVMNELLNYAVNLAHDWSCSTVKLWLTSKQFQEALAQNGFVYGEHPFVFAVFHSDLDLDSSYITMGDSDIF